MSHPPSSCTALAPRSTGARPHRGGPNTGRMLDLRCGACWALFRWDYFGSRLIEIIKDGDLDGLANGLRNDN